MSKIIQFPEKADTRNPLPENIKVALMECAVRIVNLVNNIKAMEQQIGMSEQALAISVAAGMPNPQMKSQLEALDKAVEKAYLLLADELGWEAPGGEDEDEH